MSYIRPSYDYQPSICSYDTNLSAMTDEMVTKIKEPYLKKEEIYYNKIYSERPTLNDVFLELTGKELRD